MNEASGDSGELLDEFHELVGQLRAYLTWHKVEGTSGVPRDTRSPGELKQVVQAHLNAASLALPQPTWDHGPEPAPQTNPAESSRSSRPSPETTDGTPRASTPRAPAPAVTPPAPARSLPVVGKDLDELKTLVASCAACELHSHRKQTVFSRGSGSSGLCFIGEGPGADEDEQGYPFVGAAGQLLDKMIDAMGLSRDEVYVCNIVKCRPPDNRKPTPQEMSACSPFLKRQIELINPQVIVALGATAVSGLLDDQRGITKIRGKFRLYQGKIAVMPTFHPAYLLRNPAAKREVWSDLRQVLQHLGRTLPNK